MKTVGIILRQFESEYTDLLLYGVGKDLVKFLNKYDNVTPICIPVEFENEKIVDRIKRLVDMCDGIVFPGGNGITEVDCEIMRYAYEKDKPTLAICLGMQIMGKTFEGKVNEGVVEEHYNRKEKYVHNITIDENSRLYEILGDTKIKVNSRHRDCVEYTNLDCVARSEENIIEAIEDKNKKFFIGVQWHPETISNDEYSKKIFDNFISKL